jgi:hypothetical protein
VPSTAPESGPSNIKKQNPGTHVGARVVPTYDPPLVPTYDPPNSASGSHVGAIQQEGSGTHGGDITSLTSRGLVNPLSGLLEGEIDFGPNDPRTLDAKARHPPGG